jgi:hypothetical protein
MIGTNMRHVVSAIDNIKTVAGEGLESSPSVDLLLMYPYTIPAERQIY